MTSLFKDIKTIRPIIQRTSAQTQSTIARLARADNLDELLAPFVFTFSSTSAIWRQMAPQQQSSFGRYTAV
jgi:hypothetical protein